MFHKAGLESESEKDGSVSPVILTSVGKDHIDGSSYCSYTRYNSCVFLKSCKYLPGETPMEYTCVPSHLCHFHFIFVVSHTS